MGQFSDWWLNRKVGGSWRLPISSWQGFRPVGGYLIGNSTAIEFVPNRFEAMIGGSPWRAEIAGIERISLGRRRLRIVCSPESGGSRTLFTNRPKAARRHLSFLLDRQPAS